ncbi:hypothetical protein [Nocardia niigatensis]
MSDNPFRAKLIERLARYMYAEDHGDELAIDPTGVRWAWERRPEAQRVYLRFATRMVDAVFADMVPTGEQWGLLAPDVPFPDFVTPLDDEAEARRYLDDEPGRKLMRQYTYEWREADA